MSVTDELLANNARYAESFTGPLPLPPSRHVAVLACMDARLDVYRVLGLAEGEAHVIRNAGGVVTDDEIRSLAISQRLLGTKEIVLIHHTDCGMLTFTDEDLLGAIERDTGIRPTWSCEASPTSRTTSARRSLASPTARSSRRRAASAGSCSTWPPAASPRSSDTRAAPRADRALADDHQRGVAEVALDVELGGVAVAAVDAHRVRARSPCATSEANSLAMPASRSQRSPARRAARRREQHQLAGGGQLGGHVGQVVADRLVPPDRLAERLAVLRVRAARPRTRPAPTPSGPRGHLDAAGLQAAHHLGEARALDAAEQRRRRHRGSRRSTTSQLSTPL